MIINWGWIFNILFKVIVFVMLFHITFVLSAVLHNQALLASFIKTVVEEEKR